MSADQPPVGPNPPDDLPEPPADHSEPGMPADNGEPDTAVERGEPGASADHPASGMSADYGEPETGAEHPASGMPSATPQGFGAGPAAEPDRLTPPWSEPPELPPPPAEPRGLPTTWAAAPAGPNPNEAPAAPRMHWALVLVGIPVGFVAWVFGSLLILNLWSSSSGFGSTGALVVLVVLLAAAVGLIVWRRTRRLAQGFVLGLAIGLVVAGGLCVPLVSSIGF